MVEEDLNRTIVKRSIVVSGHKTSVSLEEPFWECLKEIAGKSDRHLSNVVADIKANRGPNNLSSAIRLFVFEAARAEARSPKV
jgi:predicted DNA-binding ribbon-helix-helix protein